MLPPSSKLHFYGFQGAGGIAGWRNFALSSVDELAASVASAEKDEALTPSESRITHRDHVGEKLLDRGLPAKAFCMRAAEFARNLQRCHGGRSQVPFERAGTAVADDVERSGDRQGRHGDPAGQRLE